MLLKISFAKCRPFCLGLYMLLDFYVDHNGDIALNSART